MSRHLLTPRMKPLSSRRSTLLSVLDVGSSKVVCLIAKLLPAEPSEMLRGRTHRCKILGIGHQRANRVDDLGRVMRRDIGRHADGDAAGAVHQ